MGSGGAAEGCREGHVHSSLVSLFSEVAELELPADSQGRLTVLIGVLAGQEGQDRNEIYGKSGVSCFAAARSLCAISYLEWCIYR